MSENPVQDEKKLVALDFSGVAVTGLPGGVFITTINGDATLAQSLSAQSPGFVSNNGVGGHVVVFPDFGPLPIPHGGLVSNPGPAAPTDYLGADNTFRPIPATGLVSINGDATPAQVLAAGTAIGVAAGPAGTTTISGIPFANGQPGIVNDPVAAGAGDYLGGDNAFHAVPIAPGPSLLTDTLAGPVAIVTGVTTIIDSVTGLIPGDIYLFIGQVQWLAFANNSTAVCTLFVNATPIATQTLPFCPAGGGLVRQNLSVCGTVGNALDVVSLKVFQDSGLAVTVSSGGATFLQALHLP